MTTKNSDGSTTVDPVTEYGIQLPDGRYQWEGELGIVNLNNIPLHTSAGRGSARDEYARRLQSVGINPNDFALRFVTRKRLLSYTAPVPVVEKESKPLDQILDDSL